MRNTGLFAAVTLLIVPVAHGGWQAPPSTDVWLASLDLAAEPVTITAAVNLTDRDGYDNQPSFEPEGRGLLYTSQRGGQTDIYRFDLGSRTASRLTETAESEYSATVMPGGDEFSVVRVEADGAQRLWAFRRDGSSPRIVLESIAPVGYYAWGDRDQAALFVLGEPATLQLASVSEGTAREVASDIGRSLHAAPGGGFSFLQRVARSWRIRLLDPETGTMADLGEPVGEAQDMAWTPERRMLMASGSTIHVADPRGRWRQVADLSAAGVSNITRLAVSPDATALAFVAARGQ